jgi:hypothetical protein
MESWCRHSGNEFMRFVETMKKSEMVWESGLKATMKTSNRTKSTYIGSVVNSA